MTTTARRSDAADVLSLTGAQLERFWSRVTKTDGDGCWLYTGPRLRRKDGSLSYGSFSLGKSRGMLAHRLSYQLAYGDLKDDLKVCHTCDTPQCVRPSHLFLGTQADNLADMRAKGRARFNRFPSGTNHPNAKLNAAQVCEVHALRASGLSCAKIGDIVGLHASTVHDIVTGKTRRDVIPRGARPARSRP